MKNYLRNKSFIPKKYVKNAENKEEQGNRRGIIWLVIINLFMVPITVRWIIDNKKDEEIPMLIEEGIAKDSIIGWLNEIDQDIEELIVMDNRGIMIIKDINKIYSLENNEDININNIIQNEKGEYILEVTREN